MAILVARTAYKMKGEDIVVLNVRKVFPLTDYFVIVTANSRVHSQALCTEILEEFEKKNLRPFGIEGYQEGRWVLMDYGDVVVHIFLIEEREYYDLEMLWGDAKKLNGNAETLIEKIEKIFLCA